MTYDVNEHKLTNNNETQINNKNSSSCSINSNGIICFNKLKQLYPYE